VSSASDLASQYIKAKKAGDDATVDAIIDDAINRLGSRDITPGEYNALLVAAIAFEDSE
jgi:hypothetical protein